MLATNVEFWSAVVLDFAGVPPELFTPMFSSARVGGWSAHILEQKREGRLIRPTAKYVGPAPRRPRTSRKPRGGSRPDGNRHGGQQLREVALPGRDPRGARLPCPSRIEEQERIRALIARLREIADELIDPRKAEEQGWIGDDVIAALGEAGLCGACVDEEYGGQGLSQTGYCRVSEVFAQIDPTLSVIMGVHQSIGMKPIALYGSDEQKARFLPDLAAAASSPPSR